MLKEHASGYVQGGFIELLNSDSDETYMSQCSGTTSIPEILARTGYFSLNSNFVWCLSDRNQFVY